LRRAGLLLGVILAIATIVPFYNLPEVYGVQSSLVASTAPPPQGVVCFSMNASSCPPSPVQFSAPLGGTFTAYVVIQGSEAFNGFNIWFEYPYGVLNATSVSLQGSVLPRASVQFECVNGKGSPSCGYWLGNGPGIAALYATGNLTTAPTTGLLFSVSFKVTASGSGGLGFFCVTSPSGPWLENCASVFNGSTSLNVNVQGGSFATAANSGNTIPVRQMIIFDHLTATITGNLTLDTTAKTLTGTVSVVVVNSTGGQPVFSKTFSVLMSFGSNPSFKFVLLIPAAPFALGAICTVNSSVYQATLFLARNPDMGNTGMISIVDVGVVFRDYGTVLGAPGYDPAADLDANGTVGIVDAGIVAGAFDAPVFS